MSIPGKIKSVIVGDLPPKETSLAPVVRGHCRGGADEPRHSEGTGTRRGKVICNPMKPLDLDSNLAMRRVPDDLRT
jgi:hypothetical protein